ncbi:hypothetical protein ASZ90_017778 [hydrocarbon metagenome]|uniref:Uncharacterized protein n=1 Tax=hydrocarbon metagenome TaxID=938273 RepID=A0A0W8E836_9ZZZZ
MKIIKSLIAVLVIISLTAVCFKLVPGSTASIKDVQGQVIPGSITSLEKVG